MAISLEILMASYNSEDWLAPQIESILSQTHKDFRLLIRDDQSTDRTLELIDEFVKRDSRVVLVPTDGPHLGAAQNFSALLDVAEADYVMFSDHDDVWLPQKVEMTLNAMKEAETRSESTTPILVHTDFSIVGAQMNLLTSSFWRHTGLNPIQSRSLNRLIVRNNATGFTMLLNRNLVKMARPVSEDAKMHDHWIALVASAFGEIVCLNQPTVLYRQHRNNLIGVKKRYNTRNIIRRLWKKGIYRGTWDFYEGLKSNYGSTQRQASAFFERYNKKLSPNQINTLRDYARLKQMKALPRRITTIKHLLYYIGLYCVGLKNRISSLLFN